MKRPMRISVRIVLLMLILGLVGCAGSDSLPSAPTSISQGPPTAPPPPARPPTPPPAPIVLAVFTDPPTGFSTSDVYDVQEQLVRFNTAGELIWVADDRRFPEFIANGNFIDYHHKGDHFMQIRLGTKDGQRRAYLSWPDHRSTIVDLWLDDRGVLRIEETSVRVPGT